MKNTMLTFKSNLPTFTLLQLHSQDIDSIKVMLRDKFKQAPMMFIGMQLIADLTAFEQEELTLSIKELQSFLLGEGVNLVAVMSNKQTHRQLAVEQGVGAIPLVELSTENKKLKKVIKKITEPTPTAVNQPAATTKKAGKAGNYDVPRKIAEHQESVDISLGNQLVKHTVRSGQRVYSRGDLTVVGSVSVGAEVISDGNIHIYGALRGRAIAGAKGDENACIFCHKLEAELISIAGNYKPNEEIDEQYRHKMVQISLEDEKICFLTL
ncbi:MAG: septum site-determining protein MinC [Gammaproteobacteria bacterium]|nr:MAG: septum site-determining protein MinC [Gammaproteobacteria bacterium]